MILIRALVVVVAKGCLVFACRLDYTHSYVLSQVATLLPAFCGYFFVATSHIIVATFSAFLGETPHNYRFLWLLATKFLATLLWLVGAKFVASPVCGYLLFLPMKSQLQRLTLGPARMFWPLKRTVAGTVLWLPGLNFLNHNPSFSWMHREPAITHL
jgi:hypothetical protein